MTEFQKWIAEGANPASLMAGGANLNMYSQALNGFGRIHMNDAAVAGGMSFLISELEKLDPKVRGPMTSVTWMRDLPVKRGGGWIDYTSVQFVDYGNSGPNQFSLTANATTQIPMVSANLSKDIYPVFNWQNVMKVRFVDLQKSQTIGRSLEEMLTKGINLNWNKTIDFTGYNGVPDVDAPGLVNNPNVSAASVAAVGTGNSTHWADKTPDQIVADVNKSTVATWAASEYDLTGMATHHLIPPAEYADICNRKVSEAGNVSVLTYILENNIAKNQGMELKIFPSRWCIGAGEGGTDRMVSYVNDEDRLYFDIPVPVGRVMTQATVFEGGAYLTLYAGQIGVLKILYPQAITYSDGL